MGYLFEDCCRAELKVLIMGLENLKEDGLNEDEKVYRGMCLGTLKHQLENRYEKYD